MTSLCRKILWGVGTKDWTLLMLVSLFSVEKKKRKLYALFEDEMVSPGSAGLLTRVASYYYYYYYLFFKVGGLF